MKTLTGSIKTPELESIGQVVHVILTDTEGTVLSQVDSDATGTFTITTDQELDYYNLIAITEGHPLGDLGFSMIIDGGIFD